MKSPARYHPFSALIHWLVVVLVVSCFVSVMVASSQPRSASSYGILMNTHLITGQLLFLLNLIRLSFFSAFGTPAAEGVDFQQVHVSRLLHALLYGAVGFLACTGSILVVANVAGQVVMGVQIPLLLTSTALGLTRELHMIGSTGFVMLCAVHAMYALALHYFFGQRTTLQKMRIQGNLLDYLAGPEVEKGFARLDIGAAGTEDRTH